MKKLLLIAAFGLLFVPISEASHRKPCLTKSYSHGHYDYDYYDRGHSHYSKCGYWCQKHKYHKKHYKRQARQYRKHYKYDDHDYGHRRHYKKKKHKYSRKHKQDYEYSRISIGSHGDDGYFKITLGKRY